MPRSPTAAPFSFTAIGFTRLPWRQAAPPAALRRARWTDSWTGLGGVIVGMTAQGFNVELSEFSGSSRANFHDTATVHSLVKRPEWETTPWRAVQRAAWEGLHDQRRPV